MYSDGGARGNPGRAATGIIIKDQTGKTLYRLSKYLGIATNNQAEYAALIQGLKFLTQKGIKIVACYLDSELVVRQLNGLYRIKDQKIKEKYRQLSLLISKFKKVTFKHIYRENNVEADKLVNQTLDKVDPVRN